MSCDSFLQTDPIPGGSCNHYDYTCQDPNNNYDLDGRWTISIHQTGIDFHLGVDIQMQAHHFWNIPKIQDLLIVPYLSRPKGEGT